MIVGDALYTFSSSGGTAAAGGTLTLVATTINVGKSYAMVDPILSSSAGWPDASAGTTHTFTPNVQSGAVFSGVTCSSSDITNGITTSINAITGVCTLTGIGTGGTGGAITITWTGTETVAGYPNRTVTKVFTITR